MQLDRGHAYAASIVTARLGGEPFEFNGRVFHQGQQIPNVPQFKVCAAARPRVGTRRRRLFQSLETLPDRRSKAWTFARRRTAASWPRHAERPGQRGSPAWVFFGFSAGLFASLAVQLLARGLCTPGFKGARPLAADAAGPGRRPVSG